MSKYVNRGQEDQQSTSSQLIIKESVSDDSDDSFIDPMREPGAPYPPDTDSDEEEDIELPQWMGPVKLDFPPKVLVGGTYTLSTNESMNWNFFCIIIISIPIL